MRLIARPLAVMNDEEQGSFHYSPCTQPAPAPAADVVPMRRDCANQGVFCGLARKNFNLHSLPADGEAAVPNALMASREFQRGVPYVGGITAAFAGRRAAMVCRRRTIDLALHWASLKATMRITYITRHHMTGSASYSFAQQQPSGKPSRPLRGR
jgi:hypothetical protein